MQKEDLDVLVNSFLTNHISIFIDETTIPGLKEQKDIPPDKISPWEKIEPGFLVGTPYAQKGTYVICPLVGELGVLYSPLSNGVQEKITWEREGATSPLKIEFGNFKVRVYATLQKFPRGSYAVKSGMNLR